MAIILNRTADDLFLKDLTQSVSEPTIQSGEVIQNGNGLVSITTDTTLDKLTVFASRTADKGEGEEICMTDAKEIGMPSNLRLVEMTNPRDAKVYLEATFEERILCIQTQQGFTKVYDGSKSSKSVRDSMEAVALNWNHGGLNRLMNMTLKKWVESGSGHDLNENEKFYKEDWHFAREESVESRELKITGGEMHGIWKQGWEQNWTKNNGI
ncbi:hypothetical protein Tco_0687618 [Tanacetum coccineum]